MYDELEIPAFLKRERSGDHLGLTEELRGVKTRERATKLVMPKARLTKEERERGVKVFLYNPMPKTMLRSGWNTVIVEKIGRKKVKIRLASKTRCYVIDRQLWDKLKKEEVK